MKRVYSPLAGFQIGRRGHYGIVYRKDPKRLVEVWRCEHQHKGSGRARKCAEAQAERMGAGKA